MDNTEYVRKRDLIASSEADIEIKAKAMAELTEQYVGIQMRAMKLIIDSAPDPVKVD